MAPTDRVSTNSGLFPFIFAFLVGGTILIWLLTGWSLVRIRPGEPILSFRYTGGVICIVASRDGGGFGQKIKRLAECRLHCAILPRAVRKYEIEQPTFFARFLLREQPLCVSRQFENLDALVHVGLVGLLVTVDLVQQAPLLLAPLTSEPIVEIPADLTVELIDIHGVYSIIEPLVFSLQPGDAVRMHATLVGMAGLKKALLRTQPSTSSRRSAVAPVVR